MRRNSLFLLASFVLIPLMVAPALAMGKDAPTEVDLKVLQHIPAEPLAFGAVDFGPFDEGFDGMLDAIRRFAPEEERPGIDEKLAEFDAKSFWDLLVDPALTPHGYGATSIRVGHGSRKVAFGPEWMESGLLTVGIVAAIAIPNLINAINRSKQKRTMADIRTVGTCMEAFAVDNMIYPATEGWVPCAELADQLSPLYIHSLPTTDGWEQPLMCTSDGRNYTIVSGGRDTNIDQNYSMEFESHGTTDMDEDIVYQNGVFEIYPSGIQN